MRYAAALVLALAAGCAREPYLYEAPDRIQLPQGKRVVVVTSDGKDALFPEGTRLEFVPPPSHAVVIHDPIEPDYVAMTGRPVRIRVTDGPMVDRVGTIYRGALRAED